jgi:hypothetical protein
MRSNDFADNTLGGNLAVSLGGTSYLLASLPSGAAINTAAIIGQNGAAVTPNRTTGNFVFTTVSIDIPCSSVATNVPNTLAIVYNGQDDFGLGQVALPSCVVETCGGQSIKCPGLKATLACTPGVDRQPLVEEGVLPANMRCALTLPSCAGYDCNFNTCCDTFCVGKGKLTEARPILWKS